MTVPHGSTGRIGLTSITAAVSGLLLLLVIGLTGNCAVPGDDVPEPVPASQSDESKAPAATPAADPPPSTAPATDAKEEPAQVAAPDEKKEPVAPAEESAAPLPPKPDASKAEVTTGEPSAEPAENAPGPAVEHGPAKAEETAPLPPKPDESKAETTAGEPSAEPKPETPPATAPESPSGPASEEDAAKAAEAAPLPPKPADADVLNSVLPAADAPPATAGPPKSEMVGPPPVGQTPTDPPTPPLADSEKAKPELDLPPDVEEAMDAFMDDGKPQPLRFVFRYHPWQEVIQWFADQSHLSLVMDTPPPGTFNYTDNRSYTPAEAIDLLNSVLLVKGYTLVRREQMLFVINLEDGIPDNLVPTVPVEELDKRGEFELIGTLFQLNKFEPEEAAKEIEKMIGPQGKVVVLPTTRQLHVTETAGRLRTIRDVIQRVEDPEGLLSGELETYEFKNILPDEGLTILRQLLDIPADGNATEDKTFRFASDPMGTRLFFSGSADKIAKAKKILESIDVSSGDGDKSTALEALQLEVYPIAVADPDSVLKVMQTLLEGLPGVRLSIDPKTGSLIALARPTDHATIKVTIDQMQSEIRRIEVIPLQRVDPQLAAVAIKKMFGDTSTGTTTTRSTTGSTTPTISTGPTVEPDTLGRQLIVHGTENQITQIRVLLGKMGEPELADGATVSTGSRIRILQISGTAAETALQNLRLIWPTISDNPIKEVTPSAIIPSLRPQQAIPSRVPSKDLEQRPEHQPHPDQFPERRWKPDGTPPPGGIPGLNRPSGQPATSDRKPGEDQQTSHSMHGPFRFVAETKESVVPEPAEESPSDQATGTQLPENQPPVQPAPQQPAAAQITPDQSPKAPEANASAAPGEKAEELPKQKSPIVISRGPNGLMIASDDVQALDEFERMFNSMTGGVDSDRTELNVFYLKYAKAAVVAETLTKIIGSGTSTSSTTASTDSILGQLVAGSVGSTLGSLLNAGATTLSPTGMLRITPEPRLNALIVEANATDLRTIEEVLRLLDQPESPEEILVNPKARLIPVYNMAADEVSTIVKQVFADKMQSGSSRGGGGGEQQRPSPADFFQAMRGGGGRGGSDQRGGGSSSSAAKEEPERMTIGVDAKSNSLIVFASQQTYDEVRMLVEELDSIAGVAEDEAQEVVTIKTNPEAMKTALMAILGENAVSNSTSSSSNRSSTSSRSGSTRSGSSPPSSGGMSDDMRRRMEFMRSMMGGRGGSSGFGGSPGGGGRSGGGR